MKYKTMKKWVRALRSGKYEQGTTGYLMTTKSGADRFCCLGILCDIMGADIDTDTDHLLDATQSRVVGMRSANGELNRPYKVKGGGVGRSLDVLNDCGLSFKQIARIIEKNYKDL